MASKTIIDYAAAAVDMPAVGVPGDFVWRQIFDPLTESDDEGQATVVGSDLRGLSRVEAPDTHTLVITTREPDPILPNRLTIVMMINPQAFRELGRQTFSRKPVGTGSYQAEDWQNRNGAVLLTANPHAWRPPNERRVEIHPLRDHASRFQAALSGQLDIMAGFAPPASQGSAPGVFGHNPGIQPYPYDPQKARALLAEAGHAKGFSMEVQVVTGTYSNDLEVFAKVQQDLAAVGVELAFRSTLFSDWIRQYFQGAWRSEGFSIAWNTAPRHASWRCCAISGTNAGWHCCRLRTIWKWPPRSATALSSCDAAGLSSKVRSRP